MKKFSETTKSALSHITINPITRKRFFSILEDIKSEFHLSIKTDFVLEAVICSSSEQNIKEYIKNYLKNI